MTAFALYRPSPDDAGTTVFTRQAVVSTAKAACREALYRGLFIKEYETAAEAPKTIIEPAK